MTVSTFFPDGDPETDTVDGDVRRRNVDETWNAIRTGAGTTKDDSFQFILLGIHADTTTDHWEDFRRAILLFDTASIPDLDSIDSATFEFVVLAAGFIDDFTESISMVTSTPAANDDLVNADYGQLGTTKQATDLTLAGITRDDSTFNVFTLNATGEGNIDKTGITKFGIRITGDNDDVEPTWVSSDESVIRIASAEETVAGDKRPKLVVTHSAAAGLSIPVAMHGYRQRHQSVV